MIIYKSKYWHIHLDEAKQLITTTFNPESVDLTSEKYKEEMLIFAGLVEKFAPQRLLVNSINMAFAIDLETQEWTNTVIFPRTSSAGLTKVAIVLPPEIFIQLSLEQVMSDAVDSFTTRYFDSIAEANSWLLN